MIAVGVVRGASMTSERRKYVTVSIPKGIADAIDHLIDKLRYWPSRGAFVREACLEKIKNEKRLLKELNPSTDGQNG